MSSNSKKNRAFYKIVCKNTVETDRSQMTIWRMHIAGWIPKVTNTDSEYVIHIASPRQQRLHEGSSVLIYTYISSLIVVTSAIGS
jgi:hypothetical protein